MWVMEWFVLFFSKKSRHYKSIAMKWAWPELVSSLVQYVYSAFNCGFMVQWAKDQAETASSFLCLALSRHLGWGTSINQIKPNIFCKVIRKEVGSKSLKSKWTSEVKGWIEIFWRNFQLCSTDSLNL